MQRLAASRDAVTAALTIALGAVFLYLASGLRFGSAAGMGPGFLPNILGVLLVGLGLIAGLRALRRGGGEPEWPLLRPFIIVPLCPVIFGEAIRPLGLALTVVIVAWVARLAIPQRPGLEAIVMPAALAAFSSIVFVTLLKTPIPIWPWP